MPQPPDRQALSAWLTEDSPISTNPRYRLRFWREDRLALPAIKPELRRYFDEALADARATLRLGFEDSLSPFAPDPALPDPAENYPRLLHKTTLKGYFGESLAAFAIQHWGAHGNNDWEFPEFLFRFHSAEFEHLDQINERVRASESHEPDDTTELRPGRTGNDAIAFRRNSAGSVLALLTVEAKCFRTHASAKIDKAHEQLNNPYLHVSGIRQLISIMEGRKTPEARSWKRSLLELIADKKANSCRQDALSYACGKPPSKASSWLSGAEPNQHYSSVRQLECMEFHFQDIDQLIDILYRGQ